MHMRTIDLTNEREFANSIGYAHGRGEEYRLHIHNLIDEVDRLRGEILRMSGITHLEEINDGLLEENAKFRKALTGISLTSQNSSCTKEDCGRAARAALC